MKQTGKQILQRIAVIFFLLTAVAPLPAQKKQEAIEFSEVLGKNCELFQTARPETFLRQTKDNPCAAFFHWTSNKKTDARYDAQNSAAITLFGIPVCEMILRFENEKPVNLYISYYNRGDQEELFEYSFRKLLNKLSEQLTKHTASKGIEKTGKLSRDDKIFRNIRIKGDFVYELRWSMRRQKKRRSYEYIQLEIYPFDHENDPRNTPPARFSVSDSKNSLLKNIVRDQKSGDVYLDNIPMVDQGTKGYCLPATMERVFRYYGNEDVSQHLFAQAAESDPKHGTDLFGMMEEVKHIGIRLGVKIQVLYQLPWYESVNEFYKFLKKYNKKAKRMKFPKVDPVIRNSTWYFRETVAKMDPDIYRKTWSDEKKEFRNFQKDVRMQIDRGIPVFWSVQTGIYPEGNSIQAEQKYDLRSLQSGIEPQEDDLRQKEIGAHMRLIIGYNDKTKSILFSDAWGAGHEKKSMPEDQAWAITDSIFILIPRK